MADIKTTTDGITWDETSPETKESFARFHAALVADAKAPKVAQITAPNSDQTAFVEVPDEGPRPPA